MFHAVRQWWAGGRGKVTARLFLFEFVVVVLGVLVAQWLASVVQERGDYRRMEVARQNSLQDLAMAAKVARDWQGLHHCMVDQVTEIMQRLGRGESLNEELLIQPGIRYIEMNAPTGEEFLLLARRYGNRDAEFFRFGKFKVDRMTRHWDDIADEWQAFQSVHPANGPASNSDREQGRRAAGRIKALILRSAHGDAGGVLGAANVLNVEPSDPIGGPSASNCAQFQREKALYPKLSGRSRIRS